MSRVCGVLSVLFFLIAVITVVLPFYSVGTAVASVLESYSGAGNSSASSSPFSGFATCSEGPGDMPVSCVLTNKGVLSLENMKVSAIAFAPNGTELIYATAGPVDVPAGGTGLLTVSVPSNTTLGRAMGAFLALEAQNLASSSSGSVTNGTAYAGELQQAFDSVRNLTSIAVDVSFSVNLGGIFPISLRVNADVPLQMSNETTGAEG